MGRQKISVACFGEVLWDTFPGGKTTAGGAPFNVAYHLNKMGVKAYMISSVGNDALGNELLHKISGWNISTEGIQISEDHPTSQVIATIDEHQEAHYEIVEDVAWDHIKCLPGDIEKLQHMDGLVFGTLAARSKTSRNTLLELIEASSYTIFDINLRPPHYDISLIRELLHKTKLAKFNKSEMKLILDYLGKDYKDEIDSIKFIQETFEIKEVIVSKGSKGALYVTEDNIYDYPTIPIQVKDTIGSGDSFLAGFVSKRLEVNVSANAIMTNAVCLGAFITAQEGACPEYDLPQFNRFKEDNEKKYLNKIS
jgi:fructokinase